MELASSEAGNATRLATSSGSATRPSGVAFGEFATNDLCMRACVLRVAEQRSELEHLCRYITRPAIANDRLRVNHAGQVVLEPRRFPRSVALRSFNSLRSARWHDRRPLTARLRQGQLASN